MRGWWITPARWITQLAAVQFGYVGLRLQHDFVYAVVHCSRRVGIALILALLARTLRHGAWRQAVVAGIGGGFSIFVFYALAFWITDRLVK